MECTSWLIPAVAGVLLGVPLGVVILGVVLRAVHLADQPHRRW